jgi:hypothetical protein
MFWRIIQDMADVYHIHLPSQTLVRSIDRYNPAIRAEPWMQVNPVFAIANIHATVTFQFS